MPTELHVEYDELEEQCEAELAEHLDDKDHPAVLERWRSTILPALRQKAMKEGVSARDYRNRLLHSQQVVCELHEATHFFGSFSKPARTRFWHHQQVQLIKANDESRGIAIDGGSLLSVAARYVSHPELQNDPLDWCLMDALVFAELDAFAEQVMSGTVFGTVNLAWAVAMHNELKFYLYSMLFSVLVFGLRYVLPPALAIYAGTKGHEIVALSIAGIWFLYVFTRLISLPARWKARRKARELLHLMGGVYDQLGGSVISPTRLRDSINKAAEQGVVFDGALFALVERAVRRDDTAFVPFR